MRHAQSSRVPIAAAALLLAAFAACAKQEPCRPGTVYLRVELGARAGQVASVEVKTRLGMTDPWTTRTIDGLSARSSASLEISFSRQYPEDGSLHISIAAAGTGGPLGVTLETSKPLDAGCTAITLSLDQADGGSGGAGGSGGSGGAGGTGGAVGGSGGAGIGGGGAGGRGGTGGGGTGGGAAIGGAGGASGRGGSGMAGSAGTGGRGGTSGTAGMGGSGDVSACTGKPRSHWAEWKMPNPPVSSGLPNAASYGVATVGAQTAVCDRVTGLMWQQRADGNYMATTNREDAVEFCLGLSWAGFSGWRLPSRIELFSILDLTRPPGSATIDPSAFPGTPADIFWTYTFDALLTPQTWTIDFEAGYNELAAAGVSHRIRCVR